MRNVLDWHVRIGDLGRRLLWLQLLWVAHTLLGAVVLGIAPATAAVHAVLRRDQMAGEGWPGTAERERLPREFHRAWRRELVPANAVGLPLVAGWAFVLLDHRLLRTTEVAGAGALQVLLWVLTLVLMCVTATVWVLQAHFVEGPFRVLRRALVLVVARPLISLGGAAVLAATACLYYVVPGLAVVFGIMAPAWVTTALVWRSGILPRPADTSDGEPTAASDGAPTPALAPAR